MTDSPDWFARALRAPVRTRSHRLADGRALALRSWGDGPRPVVLVHGSGAHARWWDHIGPLLGLAGETVTAVDLAGHGDSDWLAREAGAEYDLAGWADDLIDLTDTLAPAGSGPAPILVGHSMGGLVGWTAAARLDSRLAGLIVIDAPLGDVDLALSSPIRPIRPHRVYPDREEILARFRTLPDQPTALPYVLAHIARTSITPARGGWRWRHDPAVLHHAYFTTETPDPRRLPLALLLAENSIVRPPTMRYLAQNVGEAIHLQVLPGAGHHAMLDQPHLLVETLRRTLDCWYDRGA